MIKLITNIFIIISGVSAYISSSFGNQFCIYEYYKYNAITYFHELGGVSANDLSMLQMCGLIAIIVGLILFFTKSRILFGLVFFIMLMLQLIILNMMETASFFEILCDSIMYCLNWAILIWFATTIASIVLSLKFIFGADD